MKITNIELKNKLTKIGCFENDEEDITYSYVLEYLLTHHNKFITVLPSLDNLGKFVFFIKDIKEYTDDTENSYDDYISTKEYDSVIDAYNSVLEKLLQKELLPEELISVTYSLIKNTCGWSKFCDVTNNNHYAINGFGEFEPDRIFKIKKEDAKKLNFI